MVKPGGTGRPALVMVAQPAPLPPRRLRSALPSSNRYTHFWVVPVDGEAVVAWAMRTMLLTRRPEAHLAGDGRAGRGTEYTPSSHASPPPSRRPEAIYT